MRGHTWRRQRQPGGEIEITGVDPVVLVEPLKALRKMGAGIRISGATGPKARIGMVMERRPAGVEIDTGPYPGFPTDLQSVFLAVEAAGSGESRFKETVYEARFEAAMRLAAFGADVSLHKDTAIIRGRYPLVPGNCGDAGSSRRGGASSGGPGGGRTQCDLGQWTFKARVRGYRKRFEKAWGRHRGR